jgi:hypothetical protein
MRDLYTWPSYSNPLLKISTRICRPSSLDEASSLEGEGAGPMLAATARPTLQVLVGSSRAGCHADFGIERQIGRSGLGTLRKVPFGVGLEAPKRYVGSGSVCFGSDISRRRAIRIARPLRRSSWFRGVRSRTPLQR